MAGADKRFGSRGIEGSGPGFYPRQLCAYVVLINDSMSCDSQARTRERERERERDRDVLAIACDCAGDGILL